MTFTSTTVTFSPVTLSYKRTIAIYITGTTEPFIFLPGLARISLKYSSETGDS